MLPKGKAIFYKIKMWFSLFTKPMKVIQRRKSNSARPYRLFFREICSAEVPEILQPGTLILSATSSKSVFSFGDFLILWYNKMI